eukprot:Gb_03486 [translate_table: standard]
MEGAPAREGIEEGAPMGVLCTPSFIQASFRGTVEAFLQDKMMHQQQEENTQPNQTKTDLPEPTQQPISPLIAQRSPPSTLPPQLTAVSICEHQAAISTEQQQQPRSSCSPSQQQQPSLCLSSQHLLTPNCNSQQQPPNCFNSQNSPIYNNRQQLLSSPVYDNKQQPAFYNSPQQPLSPWSPSQQQQPTLYNIPQQPLSPWSNQQLPAGYFSPQQPGSFLPNQQSPVYNNQQPGIINNNNNNNQQVAPPCVTIIQQNSPMVTQQTGYAPQQGQFAGVPRSPFGLGHEMNLPIVNQRFCEPYPVELTVQKKCCSLSGGDFTIFDPTKKKIFRMSGRAFSCIRHKRRLSCLHKRWDVFLGGGCDPGQLLCRTKRGQICKWLCCHRGPVDVYNMAGQGKKRWDFRVTGSHQGLSRIYFGSRIIAEVRREFKCCNVLLGKDTLIMKVEAGVDQAFVTVLVVIMDVLSRNRGPQPKDSPPTYGNPEFSL